MEGTRRLEGYAVGVRRLLAVLTLVGLFAMHGLGACGGSHAMSPGDAMGMDISAMTTTATDVVSAHPARPDGGPMTMVGMCVAVLLLGLLAFFGVGRAGLLGLVRRTLGLTAPWPARARRGRPPPCLFALSIQRT